MLDLGMHLVRLEKLGFTYRVYTGPEGIWASRHSPPEGLAKTSFQSGLALFYKVI